MKRSLLMAALALVLLVFHVGDSVRDYSSRLGRQSLVETDEAYLEGALEESFASFLLLSGLKSGLAVMQSSEAGVSFIVNVDVQVGRFVNTAKEIVDAGWIASLVSLSSIEVLSILLRLSDEVNPYLICLLLSTLCLHFFRQAFWPQTARWTRRLVNFSLYLALMSYLIIPGAIYCASLSSQCMTGHRHQHVRDELTDKHSDLILKHNQGTVKEQAVQGVSSYMETAKTLPGRHRHLTEKIITHIVAIIFDAFVFPVGFLILFTWAGRRILFARNMVRAVPIEGEGSEAYPVCAESLPTPVVKD